MLLCFHTCNRERTDHRIIQQISLFYLLKRKHMWVNKFKKAPNLYRKKLAIEIQGCLIPVSQRLGPKLVKQNLSTWKNRGLFVYLTTCYIKSNKAPYQTWLHKMKINQQWNNEHCWILLDSAFVSKPLIVQHRRSLAKIVGIKSVLNTGSVEGN